MKGNVQIRVSTATAAHPVVYLARRRTDGTVLTERLAGSGADSGMSDPPFPALDQEILLLRNALSRHWAFGGSEEGEQERLVVMPGAGAAGAARSFRVSILGHAVDADAAVIVVQREDLSPSTPAPPAESDPSSPLWREPEAAEGLWSLAGCCRYIYEMDARVKARVRVQMIEGPFSLIYGIEPEEMKNPTFAMFLRNIFPEDRPNPKVVRKILAANGSWSGAYRVRGMDGRVRHVRHFAVLHAQSGRTYISGLILDESAAVDASAESSVFRLAVESSHEGFALTDSNGRYTYLNQEHGRLFGYQNAGELLGKEWKVLYRQREIEFIQQRISLEMPKAGFWHGPVLAVRRDGSTFQQDLTLYLLAGGGILCICRDRSEELQLNGRLEESETMLRSLFDALPVGIIIRDEHGVRQFANGFVLREGGSGAAAIPRADWMEGDKDWERRQCEAECEVLATGKSCEYVIESVNAQQRRWFHCIVFLVQASSGVSRRFGSLIMDITRQKQLEQETQNLSEQRRELLGIQREFISMVSHEFRTPLTTIEGAQFLVEKLLSESAHLKPAVAQNAEKWLKLQASALATLRKLVDQVLMLNRTEHMTGEASLERLSPADVFAETVARFNDSMDSPRVVLRSELPAGFIVSMDSGLMKAAAENLISNGLKYSGLDKAVKVRVYAEPDGWAVEVLDQGRGIPQGDQAKLFRPFFRAGNVGTVPGTGLGLAIVKRAVDFHMGRIEFESREDAGTSFRLHFPISAHPAVGDTARAHAPLIGREQSHE